ncbi:SpoIIE family protein phosphatase [Streptomyces sp. NPDC093598]|uniref:SpoIIE family protein phosphatase n=1 Tax=Streptomyces sp. NPDC093598 TaxID=3366046 RepID=UPI003812DA51
MRDLRGSSVAVVCALLAPLLGCLALVPFRDTFPDFDSALVLMAVVVAVAAQGYRVAGLVAAVSATVWLDFFLISPWGSLSVSSSQDRWTVVLMLGTSVIVSELAARGRSQRRRTLKAHGRLKLLHDAGTAIGTTLDAERTAQKLTEVAVPRFADFVTVDLAVSVLLGEEPEEALEQDRTKARRVAMAGIHEHHPLHSVGALDGYSFTVPQADDFSHGRARLEPDLRASTAWPPLIPDDATGVLDYGMRSLIAVPLRGRGALLGTVTFWRTRQTEPFTRADLPDAEELAAKTAVAIDNARRYTRERTTALALQRSLLPQRLPEQTAVDVASRYLPAGPQTAGVGGDWYDVIPLSGCRVALVVGDVVGHGINACATMGRLRTAVRTLADVDLPPDELITHLDDLVMHLTDDQQEGRAEGDAAAAGELGATCLYAVYDPVARSCTVASAGHPLPFVLTPDGKVEQVHGFVGPPLGLGGLPFESLEFRPPTGSVLALYSNGLVQSRERDIDEGLAGLRHALEQPAASLEDACDTVMHALVDHHMADDITLLLARTRALTADQVAVWDIPADPAMVVRARKLAVEQLDTWGLWESAFVTELLVSELVTNAIRHGEPPVELRLIRDSALICEVSDASSTAPHLRRAREFDEGGRGLLLVAQLSQKWGTRHAAVGKTIWCEQKLPAA